MIEVQYVSFLLLLLFQKNAVSICTWKFEFLSSYLPVRRFYWKVTSPNIKSAAKHCQQNKFITVTVPGVTLQTEK